MTALVSNSNVRNFFSVLVPGPPDSSLGCNKSVSAHSGQDRPTLTVTALCSEGPMFRRSYIQKVLCSEGPLFRRFYVQKVLCSEGSIFRRFYVQKVLCSEISVQKVLCLESTLAIKQYYLFNLSESVYIYNKKYVF